MSLRRGLSPLDPAGDGMKFAAAVGFLVGALITSTSVGFLAGVQAGRKQELRRQELELLALQSAPVPASAPWKVKKKKN